MRRRQKPGVGIVVVIISKESLAAVSVEMSLDDWLDLKPHAAQKPISDKENRSQTVECDSSRDRAMRLGCLFSFPVLQLWITGRCSAPIPYAWTWKLAGRRKRLGPTTRPSVGCLMHTFVLSMNHPRCQNTASSQSAFGRLEYCRIGLRLRPSVLVALLCRTAPYSLTQINPLAAEAG